MSIQRHNEARLLTEQELADVDASRYPALLQLSRPDLIGLLKRLREQRDRAQTISRQQRREMRGKAEAHGARPAADNAGTIQKAQALAQAVKRVNKEIARHDEPAHAPTSSELVHKAFEMRQAARVTQHPSGGWSSGRGMKSKPSTRPTVQMDPREVGRVSQSIKVAQAKRDK
jgi:hypothetical protein